MSRRVERRECRCKEERQVRQSEVEAEKTSCQAIPEPSGLGMVHNFIRSSEQASPLWPRSSGLFDSLSLQYRHLSINTTHHRAIIMAANAMAFVYRWSVPAAIAAAAVNSSLYDVKGGTRAVIFDRLSGVKDTVSNEGTHFLVPWLQRAIIYDVRTKARNISTTTGSKDLQMVSLTLRVLHRPEVKALPKIYQVRRSVTSAIWILC